MTILVKTKKHQTTLHRKTGIKNNHDYSNELKLFKIAIQMENEKLPTNFIVIAIKTALEFEGVSDLLHLWPEESDETEKEEIISAIQDMINACK